MKNLLLALTLVPTLAVNTFCSPARHEPVRLPAERSTLELASDKLVVQWQRAPDGWRIRTAAVKRGAEPSRVGIPSGEHILLYAEEKPSSAPAADLQTHAGVEFPGAIYKHCTRQWQQAISPVALNTAGTAYCFFPHDAIRTPDGIEFKEDTEIATVVSRWAIDPRFPADILVTQTLTVKKPGWFSLASPSLVVIPERELRWATVPGYFQGDAIQQDFTLAYAYGQGVPARPVVYRERCATTLCPMVSTKAGQTVAVMADPALARDPWPADSIAHEVWNLGLSHKNRNSQLSPTVYYPVLGEPKSQLNPGDVLTYSVRYSLMEGDWFRTLKHAVYDVYHFAEALALRENQQSLTERIQKMHHYLTNAATSLWRVEEFKGQEIGGQAYLGGVVGSDKDAMKNSDYGAMWMLAKATKDPMLQQQVLPYALNFKLAQQQTWNGFFQGAAIGQYYLSKSRKFVEEFGPVVEPIGLTYYSILDIGNILLFEPGNETLRERLRLGAERLVHWQKSDGSWAVAYDKATQAEAFQDLRDFRPTFYGMVVASRILKEEQYLKAARRGADWFIENAVAKGRFLGVCGDARYAPDFATVQSAQALLDLYELTHDQRYQQAAIRVATLSTTSIYTHPVASREAKTVKGVPREDWELAQAGLGFEHGGVMGSATVMGPILLASHAGLYIRMHRLTGERLFADLARSAAVGRHAFVNPETSVASYYWRNMNQGAGPYPHHAWWQIGWLTDYLMAEAELRSGGKVIFPRGFITPKVGPHQTYGFAPGTIYGQQANLIIREGLVASEDPNVEAITALSLDSKKLFVVLLNNRAANTAAAIHLQPAIIQAAAGELTSLTTGRELSQARANLLPFGLEVWQLELKQ